MGNCSEKNIQLNSSTEFAGKFANNGKNFYGFNFAFIPAFVFFKKTNLEFRIFREEQSNFINR